ncbi:MAG: sensor histidine kinase [Muribaculaceae bacterium]
MKKSIIWLLTVVMACAFLGFIYVQITYMENMIDMRNEQFSESVMRSLNSVSSQLEQDETKYFLEEDIADLGVLYPKVTNSDFTYSIKSKDSTKSILNSNEFGSSANITKESEKEPANESFQARYQSVQETLKGQYLYQRGLLNEVILNILNQSSNRPIEERADSARVHEYLHQNLQSNGLDIPFEFALVNRSAGLVYKSVGFDTENTNSRSSYTQVLFPNDPIGRITYLKVSFPTKKNIIFSSIKFMIPSFVLSFILLVIFIVTITIAFREKRLTEMKNDFINNMTHEFKTPISTISLAAQMLNDDSIRKSPELFKHVSGVINDETKRLRFQVEKVLQMSMFDRQKATLRIQPLEANNIIQNVVNTFKIKVEKYGGSIEANLDAPISEVNIDEMHFTNVIFNLLDNAVKYRKEDTPLHIKVATQIQNENTLVITIGDNGIGIKKEDLKRIFDKFYRVSTGNRHDVKGFGLGLAYVHKMITELKGEISVESEYNKGSNFIIKLPLIN